MTQNLTILEASKGLFRQFMRFGVIGVLNTVLFYTLYLLFLTAAIPTTAYFLAYVLSMAFAVIMNLRYTFKKRATARKLVTFVCVYLVSMYIGVVALKLLIGLSIGAKLAGLLVIGITIVTNFLGLKAAAKWA